MSGREWKPGDVAMLQLRDLEVLALRTDNSGWVTDRGAHFHPALHARPLVVIDPEDRETVRAIADAAYPEGRANTNRLQAALRDFANPTPPKPDEPTGLGAVVEDAEGIRFTRVNRRPEHMPYHWHSRDGAYRWDEIRPVRVLSEGVPNA